MERVIQYEAQEQRSHGTEQDTQYELAHTQADCISLLYIQTNEQSYLALRRAAQRIRGNIRKGDTVLLAKKSCVLVLPGTPLLGAQAVARRVYPLLADVEYALQVLCGSSARAVVQQVQGNAVVILQKDTTLMREESSSSGKKQRTMSIQEEESLPYLAFLPSYPSSRLLHMFPYELEDRYHCIPVGAERGILTLATCRPLQQEAVMYLREVTQRNIFQVRCEAGMIDDVLRHWQNAIAV